MSCICIGNKAEQAGEDTCSGNSRASYIDPLQQYTCPLRSVANPLGPVYVQVAIGSSCRLYIRAAKNSPKSPRKELLSKPQTAHVLVPLNTRAARTITPLGPSLRNHIVNRHILGKLVRPSHRGRRCIGDSHLSRASPSIFPLACDE